jgi:hypothetical protein
MRLVSASIANGFVIICMPVLRIPLVIAAVSAYPVMNRIFRSGRCKRAASATDLAPVEPGQPDVRDQKVDALLRLQYPQAGWTGSGSTAV